MLTRDKAVLPTQTSLKVNIIVNNQDTILNNGLNLFSKDAVYLKQNKSILNNI